MLTAKKQCQDVAIKCSWLIRFGHFGAIPSNTLSRYLLYQHIVIETLFMNPLATISNCHTMCDCLELIISRAFHHSHSHFDVFIFSVIHIQNSITNDHCPKSIRRSAMMHCPISNSNHRMTFACHIACRPTTMAAVAVNGAA